MVAALAEDTRIGPADLLAAPPEVFWRMVERMETRQKERKRQALQDRLRRGK